MVGGMRDPRLLAAPGCVGVYHLCSRIVDKRFVIKQREKVRFMELARGGAAFAGVELLSWCVMDNHFHLLVRVSPVDAESLDDEEVFRRIGELYSPNKCSYLRGVWQRCGDAKSRARFLAPYRRRMGNLSDFMKTLKQRFSQWYNLRKGREGTLWEGRFRSVLLEHSNGDQGLGPLVRFVAGYIDLNPVRARMVARSEQSPWNAFGLAVRGDDLALSGLKLLWGERLTRRLGEDGLIDRHRQMLDKDEPLGSMLERQGGARSAGNAQPDRETASAESLTGAQPSVDRHAIPELPPNSRMSRYCPEISRARFLGQPRNRLLGRRSPATDPRASGSD